MSNRDLALLNLLGVVQHAAANLNLNDPAAALKTLMDGLAFYDRAVTGEARPQSIQIEEGETYGNTTAA
jgi:hypothetical protein